MSEAHAYFNAIKIIRSEYLKDLAIATSISNMKKEARKKYFDELNKNQKLVSNGDADKLMSTEDAAKKLAMGLMRG